MWIEVVSTSLLDFCEDIVLPGFYFTFSNTPFLIILRGLTITGAVLFEDVFLLLI